MKEATKLKHWDIGNIELGYGQPGIKLINVLSVCKNADGITFTEECDGYYSITMSKEDALEAVEELRQWILKN